MFNFGAKFNTPRKQSSSVARTPRPSSVGVARPKANPSDRAHPTPEKKGGVSGANFIVANDDDIHRVYKFDNASRQDGSATGTAIVMATQRATGQKVVIKTFERSSANKAREREWRATAQYLLNIPPIAGICQHPEVWETPTAYYDVMERCMGKDLFEHIAAGTPRRETLREIMRQFLDGLRLLHASGRIHKDLKLRNVVADVQGMHVTVKIIDLDTMCDFVPGSRSKTVLGSDGYIAPEAYDGSYSPASDVYSAGAILYRLITKAFPHKRDIFDDKPGENYPGHPSMLRVKKRIETAKINWNLAPLDTWPEAVSLLQAMLAVSCGSRITAAAALRHKFFDAQPIQTPCKDKASGYPSSCKSPTLPPIDIAAASTCDTLPDLGGMDSDSDDDF